MRTTGRPWSCMKRVGPAAAEVRECAAEVVRVARVEQCLPGAKLVDTVSELALVAIRTAATSYPRAAELSLQGQGGAPERVCVAGGWGTDTLASAVGWPRVHNRRSAATLCPGTDAVQGNPRHTACCGKDWCGVRHLVSGRIFGEGGAPTAPAAAAPNHRCSGTGACSDTGPNGCIRPYADDRLRKIAAKNSFVNCRHGSCDFPFLARPALRQLIGEVASRAAPRERARVSRHARAG